MSTQPNASDEVPTVAAMTTPEHVLLYANAQNLVSRWNNLIIQAKTGEEQLALMRQSGIFAKDIAFTFDFGKDKLEYHSLTEPVDFFNSFVNPLKKPRYNIASNVEALEFGQHSLRFRFKHWIFFGDTMSVVGDNECVMRISDGRAYLTSAYIRVIHYQVEHAYP